MHLLSFRVDEERSFGALVEGRIVDLGRHMPEFDSLRELLSGGALVRALDTAAEESAEHRSDRIVWLPPLRHPDHLHCVFDDPESDSVTVDPPTVVGHQRGLPCPADDAVLWAGIALVVGPGETDQGTDQIAGITLISYLVPGGAAMGPTMATIDEVEGLGDLQLTFRSGEAEAELELPDLARVYARVAEQHELAVGDLIAFLRQIPEVDLANAERISLHSDILGELDNPLVRDSG